MCAVAQLPPPPAREYRNEESGVFKISRVTEQPVSLGEPIPTEPPPPAAVEAIEAVVIPIERPLNAYIGPKLGTGVYVLHIASCTAAAVALAIVSQW